MADTDATMASGAEPTAQQTGGPGRPAAGVARRCSSLIGALVLALAVVLAGSSPASAHSGNQSYLYLDVTESSLAGRIELPIADLRVALGLTLDGSDEEILAELGANREILTRYVDEHLDLSPPDGEEWALTFGEAEMFFSDAPEVDDNYIVLPFEATVDQVVPREFDVKLDLFFDEIEGRDHLLLIGNDWRAGVIENGSEDLAAFDASSPVQTIDLGQPSVFRNLTSSIELGINHIRTGPDHILFVLVLLLPSVLVFRDRWLPTDRFSSALWRVLKVVTMFTVAHSITFTLAGLGFLPLPSPRIVESVIALSIAAAALHNIRPIFLNKEWLLSFVFGLFHGMGFASLVSGLDVSRGTQLVSLLGRNIGIEIGQAAVVVLLFPALFLLRRSQFYRPLFVALSLLLTVVALGWMVERLFETDLGVSAFVDPVFVWPRIFFYVVAVTAAAAGYYLVERNGDRLEPVASMATTGTQSGSRDEGEA